MAAADWSAKASNAVGGLRNNPAIQRALQDDEVRENAREALASLRQAYGRLNNGKPASKVLLEDKRFQRELQDAAARLQWTGAALKEGPRRRRRGGFGKLLVVGIVGAGLALALSEGLRNKVLDALFGAEEEFEYTSTTTPAPAPEAVGTP